MKKTEFKNRLKDRGYELVDEGLGLAIKASSKSLGLPLHVLTFKNDALLTGENGNVSFEIIALHQQSKENLTTLIQLTTAYLMTPLEEREESKVKIRVTGEYADGLSVAMPDSDLSYVNHDVDNSRYVLSDGADSDGPIWKIRTHFNKSDVKGIMAEHFPNKTYVIEQVEEETA